MKKLVFVFAPIIACLVLLIFVLRFLLGGPEDDWLCVNGQWVRHGVPSSPMPTQNCTGR